jgi:glutathione peroxidase
MTENIYDIQISGLNREEHLLDQFHGSVTLFINIVSKYGYTPHCSKFWSYARTLRQFWQLQKVHDEFKDRGFSVVGVPCNQFGQMEPGKNEEILSFIKQYYPFVTFPITEKIKVNGPDEHVLYSYLKGKVKRNISAPRADGSKEAEDGQNLEGDYLARIPHNWEKFIVSRSGKVITRFNWQAMPLDSVPLTTGESWTIREAIDEILG